jgi:hypothetical protein
MHINIDKEKKKKIGMIVSITIITIFILITAFYVSNKNFRTFFDRYILRKEITEDAAISIDISDEENPGIYAFNKYITVLNKNKLSLYNSSGTKAYEFEVNISDPIYASNSKYLVIAQNGGQNLYQIVDGNIAWEKEIEGEIQKVNVNKNGYVSVIMEGSSYKTVIAIYNSAGKELFKRYLSSTTCIDTSISSDNQYLAIAEINTSGTLIKSTINIISVEKAQTDPQNSIINTYNLESNQLIKNIEYQDKDYLVYMCDNEIRYIYKEQDEQIVSFNSDKITFANIKLSNYSVYTIEKTTESLGSSIEVNFKNTTTQKENIYIVEGVVKDIKAHSNHIALNLGSEIHFITTNGWLTKKYTSEKEVKDIVLGDKIAGVVYKDKIDIINL